MRHVFTFPNTGNGDRISDLCVREKFGLVVSAKGQIYIVGMPDFEVLVNKGLPSVQAAIIQNEEQITILHGNRPIVYDLSLCVQIGHLKRPVIPNVEQLIYNNYVASFENAFVASTGGNALCIWDVRSGEPPTVLTFPVSIGSIQSLDINDYIIALGCANGHISIVDPRNPKYRVGKFQIPKKSQAIYVSACRDEPWIVGFQFSGGVAGALDTMSEEVVTVDPPVFEAASERGKIRPIFSHSRLCFGYPWSGELQLLDYRDFTSLPEPVQIHRRMLMLSSCPEYDGLFGSCSGGEIFHIL